jgi:hypothetical protein
MYYRCMPVEETVNDDAITLRVYVGTEIAAAEARLAARLDHLDDLAHQLQQALARLEQDAAAVRGFVTVHEGALQRGLGMLDAGSKMRAFLGPKKGAKDAQAATGA